MKNTANKFSKTYDKNNNLSKGIIKSDSDDNVIKSLNTLKNFDLSSHIGSGFHVTITDLYGNKVVDTIVNIDLDNDGKVSHDMTYLFNSLGNLITSKIKTRIALTKSALNSLSDSIGL